LWNAGECFDFDSDISPEAIARSLAVELWSRELFQTLKETHQSHYEQFGHLQGKIKVGNGATTTYAVQEDVKMRSMRDHTITKFRDWKQIRRYIMIVFHLEDGTCVNTSVVSMPEVVFSRLQFGYVITP
jgi:hypothetical protein